jgi:rSAM/selenodomain-associated transferase 1
MTSRAVTDNLLLIAARAPVPGETKTRLGACIGMERAAELYRAFLVDLAARFTPEDGTTRYQLGWAFTPPSCDFAATLAALISLPLDHVLFVPQHGADWGERQTNLLRWGAEHGYRRTVLMASDSPQLPRASIDAAFTALHSHDVVLGRVSDGGYYLVGMHGFHDVLAGVSMSTSAAADALAAQAAGLGLRLAELAPTFDVDVAADLLLLRAALDRDDAVAPVTRRALVALNLA